MPVIPFEKDYARTGKPEFRIYRPGATDVRSGSSVLVACFPRVDEQEALIIDFGDQWFCLRSGLYCRSRFRKARMNPAGRGTHPWHQSKSLERRGSPASRWVATSYLMNSCAQREIVSENRLQRWPFGTSPGSKEVVHLFHDHSRAFRAIVAVVSQRYLFSRSELENDSTHLSAAFVGLLDRGFDKVG
jgi:hypothetical protein